jgi:RNA polymerase sigma-70 factor (ECF subfamily)
VKLIWSDFFPQPFTQPKVTAYIQYTDAQLLELLAQGDRIAFDTIYDRYWKVMYQPAYKRLRNKQQCQEIIQDVFIDLWLRRGQVDINNVKAYLLTAIRFQVYKVIPKGKANPAFFELHETASISFSGAEANLIEKELLRMVKSWIEVLPAKRKRMFLMHIEDNLSTKEIAERLRVSQKTVQNQVSTAMQGLRGHIAGFFSRS